VQENPEAATTHEGEAEENGEEPAIGEGRSLSFVEEEIGGAREAENGKRKECRDDFRCLGGLENFTALGQVFETDVVIAHAGKRLCRY
jgi:hypothetical protein